MIGNRDKFLCLGQQLSTIGAEFRLVQIGLEKAIEAYGMSSPEAIEVSRICSDFALLFMTTEEEFMSLLNLLKIRHQ